MNLSTNCFSTTRGTNPLNSALMAYGTDGVQRAPFHDLSDLVKAGLLKKLPTPPAGKKYVFDPKAGQAKLENQ